MRCGEHLAIPGLACICVCDRPTTHTAFAEKKIIAGEKSSYQSTVTPPSPENTQKMDSTLRQPKKRFVGRRTAEAQAQASPTTGDVESTAVQKGIQNNPSHMVQ